LSAKIPEFGQDPEDNRTSWELNLYNISKEFTGNYLTVSVVGTITDENGIQIEVGTAKEIRLEDYLLKSSTEKALESTTAGAATTITIYSIVTILTGVVFNKSLAQLWNMLTSIQYFYFIKYINYSWPWMIKSSIEHYSLVTL